MRDIDDLLTHAESTQFAGRCKTCNHEHAEAINAETLRFNERRKGPVDDPANPGKMLPQVYLPWTDFIRLVLQPEYGYDKNVQALKRHVEKCLNVTPV